MIRKSRLALLIVAASLPMLAACSDTVSGPRDLEVRKDISYDSLIALGCGDVVPWGKAPCTAF